MNKTPLYDWHLAHGAKMTSFAGWQMPVFYSSIIEEHKAVRQNVGLFDVSHMGEILIKGDQALDFLQYLTSNDLNNLAPGKIQYSMLLNEKGGVVDDLLIYAFDSYYLLIVNAGNIEKVLNHLEKYSSNFDVEILNESDDYGILALQGPLAEKLLSKISEVDLSPIRNYHWSYIKLNNKKVLISRTGYTGEEGFELFPDSLDLLEFADLLVTAGKGFNLKLCGLGARDTLRLEAGLPLHGHELNDDISPLAAGLGRFLKLEKGDFLGENYLKAEKENGGTKKLVKILLEEKAIARQGNFIFSFSNRQKIGIVTSGTFSPILEKPIAIAFIENPLFFDEKELKVEIRGRLYLAKVVEYFYKRRKLNDS
jgi:aminomethyltransferase